MAAAVSTIALPVSPRVPTVLGNSVTKMAPSELSFSTSQQAAVSSTRTSSGGNSTVPELVSPHQSVLSRVIMDMFQGLHLNPVAEVASHRRAARTSPQKQLGDRARGFRFTSPPEDSAAENDTFQPLKPAVAFNERLTKPSSMSQPDSVRTVLEDMQTEPSCPDVVTAVAAVQAFALAGLGHRTVDVLATVGQVMLNVGATITAMVDVVLHAKVVAAVMSSLACEGHGHGVMLVWKSYQNAVINRKKSRKLVADLFDGTGYADDTGNDTSSRSAANVSNAVVEAINADVEFALDLKSLYAVCLAVALSKCGSVAASGGSASGRTGNEGASSAASSQVAHTSDILSALHSLALESGIGPSSSVQPAAGAHVSLAAAISLAYKCAGYKVQARKMLARAVAGFAAQTASGTPPHLDSQSFSLLVLALGSCGLTNDLRALMGQASTKAVSTGAVDGPLRAPLQGDEASSLATAWLAAQSIRSDDAAFTAVWKQLCTSPAMQRMKLMMDEASGAVVPRVDPGNFAAIPIGSIAAVLVPEALRHEPDQAVQTPSVFAMLTGCTNADLQSPAPGPSGVDSADSIAESAPAPSSTVARQLYGFTPIEAALENPPSADDADALRHASAAAVSTGIIAPRPRSASPSRKSPNPGSFSATSASSSPPQPGWLAHNLRTAHLLSTGRLRDALVGYLPVAASAIPAARQRVQFLPVPETVTMLLHAVCADVSADGRSRSGLKLPSSIISVDGTAQQQYLSDDSDGHVIIEGAQGYINLVQAILSSARAFGLRPRHSDIAAVIELHGALGNVRLAVGDVRSPPHGPNPLFYAALVRGMSTCGTTSVMECEWIAKLCHEDRVDLNHAGLCAAVELLSQRFSSDMHVIFRTSRAAGQAALEAASNSSSNANTATSGRSAAAATGSDAALHSTAVASSLPHVAVSSPTTAATSVYWRALLLHMSELRARGDNTQHATIGQLPPSAAAVLSSVVASVLDVLSASLHGSTTAPARSQPSTVGASASSAEDDMYASIPRQRFQSFDGATITASGGALHSSASFRGQYASDVAAAAAGAGGVKIPDIVEEGHAPRSQQLAAQAAAEAGAPAGFQVFGGRSSASALPSSSPSAMGGGDDQNTVIGGTGAGGTASMIPAGAWKQKRTAAGSRQQQQQQFSAQVQLQHSLQPQHREFAGIAAVDDITAPLDQPSSTIAAQAVSGTPAHGLTHAMIAAATPRRDGDAYAADRLLSATRLSNGGGWQSLPTAAMPSAAATAASSTGFSNGYLTRGTEVLPARQQFGATNASVPAYDLLYNPQSLQMQLLENGGRTTGASQPSKPSGGESVSSMLRKDCWEYRLLGYGRIGDGIPSLSDPVATAKAGTTALELLSRSHAVTEPPSTVLDVGALLTAVATPPPTFEANIRALKRSERSLQNQKQGSSPHLNGSGSPGGLRRRGGTQGSPIIQIPITESSASATSSQLAGVLDRRAAADSLPIAHAILKAEHVAALNAGRVHHFSDIISDGEERNRGSNSGRYDADDEEQQYLDSGDGEMHPETLMLEEACREIHSDSARLETELHTVASQLMAAEARLNRFIHIGSDMHTVARASVGGDSARGGLAVTSAAAGSGAKPSAALMYLSSSAGVSSSAPSAPASDHSAGRGGRLVEGEDAAELMMLPPMKARTVLRRREAALKSALQRLRHEEDALLSALNDDRTIVSAAAGTSGSQQSLATSFYQTHGESIASMIATGASLEATIERDDRKVVAHEDGMLSSKEGLRAWAGLGGSQARLASGASSASPSAASGNDQVAAISTMMLDAISNLSATSLSQIGRNVRVGRSKVRSELEMQSQKLQASVLAIEEFAHSQAEVNGRLKALVSSFTAELARMDADLEETAAESDAARLSLSKLELHKAELQRKHAAETDRIEKAVSRMRTSLARELSSRVDTAQSEVSRALEAAAHKGRMQAAIDGAAALEAVKRSNDAAIARAQAEASELVSPAVHARLSFDIRSNLRLEEGLEKAVSSSTIDAGKKRELHARIAAENSLLQSVEASLLRARVEADHILAVDSALHGFRSGQLPPPQPETEVPAPSASSSSGRKSAQDGAVAAGGGGSSSQNLWSYATSLGLSAFDLVGSIEEAVSAVTPALVQNGQQQQSSSASAAGNRRSSRAAVADCDGVTPATEQGDNENGGNAYALTTLAYGVTLGPETDSDTAAAAMYSLDAVIALYESELQRVKSQAASKRIAAAQQQAVGSGAAASGTGIASGSALKQAVNGTAAIVPSPASSGHLAGFADIDTTATATSSALPLPPDPHRATAGLGGRYAPPSVPVSVLDRQQQPAAMPPLQLPFKLASDAAAAINAGEGRFLPLNLPARVPPSLPGTGTGSASPSRAAASNASRTASGSGTAMDPSALALQALAGMSLTSGPGSMLMMNRFGVNGTGSSQQQLRMSSSAMSILQAYTS